jgi:hypothetical protein
MSLVLHSCVTHWTRHLRMLFIGILYSRNRHETRLMRFNILIVSWYDFCPSPMRPVPTHERRVKCTEASTVHSSHTSTTSTPGGQTKARGPNSAHESFSAGLQSYCENLPIILFLIYINTLSKLELKSLSENASSTIRRTEVVNNGIHDANYTV